MKGQLTYGIVPWLQHRKPIPVKYILSMCENHDGLRITCLFDDVRKSIARNRLSPLTLFNPKVWSKATIFQTCNERNRDPENEGADATSAATFARPCRASIGVLMVVLGRASSNSRGQYWELFHR